MCYFIRDLPQLFRYGIVGFVAMFFDYSALVFLTEICSFNHLFSAVVGFFVGLLVNYSLSIKFVFVQRRLTNKKMEFCIFSVVGVGGLVLTLGLMWLLTDILEVYYVTSKAVAVVVCFLWNFYARKFILFEN